MRKPVIEAVALATLLVGAVLAWGQQPAPPPQPKPAQSKLEEMLEKALRDNPDVRLAAAKVAEAVAELNRSRLLVVQKVASAYQAVEAQKAAVESAAAELDETRTVYKSGTAPQGALRAAEQKLIEAKAKLTSLEAELPYLLGQPAASVDDKLLRFWLLKDGQQPPDAADAEMLRRYYLDLYGRLPTAEELAAGGKAMQGPTADRIRAALDKPFTLVCKKKSLTYIVREMSKAFQEASRGLLIKNSSNIDDGAADDEPGELSVHFDAMPFGAALEWLEDAAPGNRVVVRNYGLVLADDGNLPRGAPLLHDFWKGGKAGDKRPSPPGANNQPAEGTIKYTEGRGLVCVSLGSDAGLAKGDKLNVYRTDASDKLNQKKDLGIIDIVEVATDEAVGFRMTTTGGDLMAGDHVIYKPQMK